MDRLKKILKWLVPLLAGLLLFWLVYKKMDFEAMKDIFAQGLNWPWMLVYFLLFLLPMSIRGLRWKQLIDPVCEGARYSTTVLSVFVAYAANLLFPRIGEVARCATLKRFDGLSFSKTMGTVVTERVFDLICLFLMAVSAILLQMNVFRDFLMENPGTADKILQMLLSWKLWTVVVLLVVAVMVSLRLLRDKPVYQKIKQFFRQMWEGMLSVRTLRRPWLFILYTILIWLFYFLSFYVGKYFFNLPFPLTLVAMFTAYVMGSFGIVAPVQGGIGAWHFMVIFTLCFYGIPESQAGAFALVVHGLNTLLTLVCGLLAYLWMVLAARR